MTTRQNALAYWQHLVSANAEHPDARQRATAHRPRTADEIRAAVHDLRSRGLGDYEVAGATGLSVEFVRRLIGERSDADNRRPIGTPRGPENDPQDAFNYLIPPTVPR